MRQLLITGLVLGVATVGLAQELDVAKLAEAYKDFDMARRGGMGYSDSPDSGSLGWGEGGIITSYINMWEATEDVYWLEKISEHFHRIMANASDPEGEGYLSWYTARYSAAVAWAERLHNVSDAKVDPAVQKATDITAAAKATGHTYLIDFLENAQRFRVVDWTTREVIADGLEHDGGETEVTQIEPFVFTITGPTHQGDRFVVRTMAREATPHVVHQGLFLYPVARLIELVQQRPELQEQFGADAEQFLQFINRNVFEKNERDWLDMGEMGGAYRSEPRLSERQPNRVIPHNQYAELARVWLVLQDVEGAHPLMAQRAEQMVRYFKSHVYLDEENDAYYWRYSNWIEFGEPGHYFAADRYESTGYGNIDIKLVVEATRRGVLFTDEDMQRFVNTWLRVMWNQDEDNPLMAARVDGIGAFGSSPLTTGWAQLSQWDPKVYELTLKAFNAQPEDEQAESVPMILLSAARAGRVPAQ
jgi:hypothetical protein